MKTERNNTCAEKRIELHLHTSFSKMDGIHSPSDYINRAKEWGCRAIAITDHGVVQALPEAYRAAKNAGIKLILGMEGYLVDDEKYPDFMNMKRGEFSRNHIILLVKEDTSFDESIPKEKRIYGRRNLYELISHSYTRTHKNLPLIPKSLLAEKRAGLIIGSACEQGEIIQAILHGESTETVEKLAVFYDYLEIQPNGNNAFMISSESETYKNINSEKDLINLNWRVIEIADKLGKPVVATGDVHFLDEEDAEIRAVIMNSKGFADADNQPDLHFKSTDEMLDEFAWAGDRAKEFVIDNPNKIADMVMDDIPPIPLGIFRPCIDGADEKLKKASFSKAEKLYGKNLPEIVSLRLNRELDAIINHGFSTHYVLAMKAVEDSEKHGYHVGTRGGIGSSLVAYFCGITNINPLAPYYYCEDCKHTEFITDGSVGSGFDLPAKNCPVCNKPMKCDGHEIPFETFMGFDGDKEPDIDLNFSDEYKPQAHKIVKELFDESCVFKAGTITTISDKMAYDYVMKYLEKHRLINTASNRKMNRLIDGCIGIKQATGYQAGGLVVVPDGYSIHDFTPIQYSENSAEEDDLITHFDQRNALYDTLLTTNMLGHCVPTMLKYLEELTGVKADKIDLSAPELYALLTSCEPLGVKSENIECKTGTLAIPELEREFIVNMLMAAKPKNFSELVKVSGLSHGTNVWENNAENLIEKGTFDLKTVPACRDDIFVYLLYKCKEYENKTGNTAPLSRIECFKIMEFTRKGRAEKVLSEFEERMKQIGVEQWYIDSCKKIRYMFPKAQAVSNMIWSLRLLWYKLYYPQEFYNIYFKVYNEELYLSLKQKSQEEIRQLFDSSSAYHYQYQAALEMLERGCSLE